MIRLHRRFLVVFSGESRGDLLALAGTLEANVRKIMRTVLTILMYAGVLVFLIPYFRGTITTSAIFLIFGAGFAVLCGLLRCYLTEGDCGRVQHTGRDW
jgi:hypothetical protein